MITRDNYEEYFLLYVDNELSLTDRQAVDQFVRENPDLESEFKQLIAVKVIPQMDVTFDHKHLLIKENARDIIHAGNCEDYFLLYADHELDKAAMKDVEEFVRLHPAVEPSFKSICTVRVEPDMTVVFPDKDLLYKKDTNDRVIIFWQRFAAAAVVIIFAGFLVFRQTRSASSDNHAETARLQPGVIPQLHIDSTNTKTSVVTSSGHESFNKQQQDFGKIKADPVNRQSRSSMIASIKTETKVRQTKLKINDSPYLRTKEEHNPLIAVTRIDPVETDNHSDKISDNQAVSIGSITDPKTEIAADDGAGMEHINYATIAAQESSESRQNDLFQVAGETSKKSRLRGIFRKVSRVLDRNANADNDDKHDVLIGGFQIALK